MFKNSIWLNVFFSLLITALISLMINALTPSFAWAWGKTGHRVVGKIAEHHLTAQTQIALQPLLQGESLASIANWADEQRSNPDRFWQKESGRWHYINLNTPSEFNPKRYSASAKKAHIKDAYHVIIKSIDVLKNKRTSVEEKRFYLRFLTHVVGDVHQPLHVGHADDHGGNKISVRFFGSETNLHTLWDSKLIDYTQLSYSELSQFINTQDIQTIQQHLDSQPHEWILESFKLAQSIYQVSNDDHRYRYVYQHMPTVKSRLTAAGLRLAGVLNAIFDPTAVPLIEAIPNL
ncbi:S1/P1 nuclease [Algibacillus agarilyticus]|uniref:S1/P1 nuclease n=1 Tax=Algibacillus agarilyticus TaxID=2234133 RepID=UPI001E3B350F|nr:S1/P1 nuclease [Algibacillus agarilyticus]